MDIVIEEGGNEECEPYKIELEDKFHSADMNCTNCNQTDCFYWHLYNEFNKQK